MKKSIISFVLGAALATAGTAYGEEAISTMIGKKVQVEYDVVVNGKQLDVKAIAIDGKSYAPIRAFSKSVDYDLAFTNNTVILNDPAMEGSEPMATETSNATEMSDEDKETIKRSEDQIILAQTRIDEQKVKINELNVELKSQEEKLSAETNEFEKTALVSAIALTKENIRVANEYKEEQEKAITAFQSYIAKIKAKYESQQ